MSEAIATERKSIVWFRIAYNSPIILTYAIVSFAILVFGARSNPLAYLDYFTSPAVLHILSPAFYFRLVSHAFGHVGFGHYYSNFLIILLVGPLLEEKWGSRTLATMMLITAVATALLNAALFDTQLIGASGVATMLLILASVSNARKGEVPLTLLAAIFIWLGEDFIGAGSNDGISHFSHIVGGCWGALFGLYWNQLPELKETCRGWCKDTLAYVWQNHES